MFYFLHSNFSVDELIHIACVMRKGSRSADVDPTPFAQAHVTTTGPCMSSSAKLGIGSDCTLDLIRVSEPVSASLEMDDFAGNCLLSDDGVSAAGEFSGGGFGTSPGYC